VFSGERRILLREVLFGSLLNLLFPPRCVVCGQLDTWLCAPCTAQLSWIRGPVCLRCGAPLDHGELCARCRKSPPRLDAIRSPLLFEGPLRVAVHRLKYRHAWELAEPLADLLAVYWHAHPLPVDIIVPVPLHPSRLRKRGYNQAALLARAFGARVGLAVDEQALQRVRATASQMRLSAHDRRRNVEGAFCCSNGRVKGHSVLLIDDVCTTGATLEACADALRSGGAEAVSALTLGRAG